MVLYVARALPSLGESHYGRLVQYVILSISILVRLAYNSNMF